MKKQLLLSKQGIFFRIISIVLQLIVTIPIFFLLSFIISVVVLEITGAENDLLIFKIIFVLFNILWLARNSIVKVYSDRIIARDCIGAKKIIEIDNITSLRIISYKEFRKMIFESSGTNPLIANAFVLIIPMGNFITFKNKFGRDVVIGVWNYKKLYDILCEAEHSNSVESSVEGTVFVNEKTERTAVNTSFSIKTVYKYYLKMPLKMHVSTFFRNFGDTLLLPAFYSLFSMWLFSMADININKCICIVLFLLISAYKYYNVIRVVVNTDLKIIKLNVFSNNNKNVIKYENLYNLNYADSVEYLELLKNNKSKFCISTPYYKNNISQVITFEMKNDIAVVLSVNKPQELYELLSNTCNDSLI